MGTESENIDVLEEEEERVPEAPEPKFVTFLSGGEHYGIQIEYVSEIIVMQDITVIPENEDYMKGLINLRGKIIPVIDVRVRFGQEPLEYTDRTCIIIIQVESVCVGLIVEKIAEVVEIAEKDQLPAPKIAHGNNSNGNHSHWNQKKEKDKNRYVYAMGKVGEDVKLLLDPERLISDKELAEV